MQKISILGVVLLMSTMLAGCGISGETSTTGSGGVYKSKDAGQTFEASYKISEEKNLSSMAILDLVISPNNSDIIYAGTANNGIYRSSNGGLTWAESESDFTYVRKIALDATNENIIYITADLNGERALFKTVDGGVVWKKLLSQRSKENPIALDIIVDHKNTSILYATDSTGGVYKSTDAGDEWKAIYWADTPVQTLLMDVYNSNLIYLVTVDSQIYVSTNGGESFRESGTEEDIYNRYDVYSVETSKTETGVLYVLSVTGLQVSRDGGETYNSISTLLKPDSVMANQVISDPVDDKTLYLIAGKIIYKTTSGGETWQSIPLKINWPVKVFEIDYSNSSNIYMGLFKGVKQKSSLFPF